MADEESFDFSTLKTGGQPCPKCGSEISDDLVICPNCNHVGSAIGRNRSKVTKGVMLGITLYILWKTLSAISAM